MECPSDAYPMQKVKECTDRLGGQVHNHAGCGPIGHPLTTPIAVEKKKIKVRKPSAKNLTQKEKE